MLPRFPTYVFARTLGWLLIVTGAILLGDAFSDQRRGVAVIASKGGREMRIERAKDQDRFRRAMAFQWLRAVLSGGAGVIVLRIRRRAERADLLSPDFDGGSAVDDWSRSLAEEEKRRR